MLTYFCKICEFKCSKESNWKRHILTSKHLKTIKSSEKFENIFACQNCNKTYKARNSLWYHKQKCLQTKNIIFSDSSENKVVELTNMVLEVIKSNIDMQKQIQEVYKNS